MWREGISLNDITKKMQEKYFSDLPFMAVKDSKIRYFLRGLKEYKEKNKPNPITPTDALKQNNLNPSMWEIVSYRSSGKITVKPKKAQIDTDSIIEHFQALDRQYHQPCFCEHAQEGLTAEVNIADLHFGKLCWHGDTGNNFDNKIAKTVFLQIIGDIKQALSDKQIKKIFFVWTNDFFNSDNPEKTTTGGTPQDTDIRYQKLFNIGCEMLVTAIDTFAEIAPVQTFYTPSNHDEETAYHAIKFLQAWFREDKRVSIDIDAKPRTYILIGKTLVGFTHGDKENSTGSKDKASRLASLMPIEASEQWSKAIYREMHTAHLHSEHMIAEINGVIVRRISSPTATDTYHKTHGFIGSVRKAQTFLYDDERGMIEIINTPVRLT